MPMYTMICTFLTGQGIGQCGSTNRAERHIALVHDAASVRKGTLPTKAYSTSQEKHKIISQCVVSVSIDLTPCSRRRPDDLPAAW